MEHRSRVKRSVLRAKPAVFRYNGADPAVAFQPADRRLHDERLNPQRGGSPPGGKRCGLGRTVFSCLRRPQPEAPWRLRPRSLPSRLDAFADPRRAKPVISTPASLAACATVMSGLMTKFWPSSVTSSKILLHPARDHLLDHALRLADFPRLFGQHRLLALDQRRVEVGVRQRHRVGRGDVHRDLLADGSLVRRPSAPRARRSCPCLRRRRCGRRTRRCRPRAHACGAGSCSRRCGRWLPVTHRLHGLAVQVRGLQDLDVGDVRQRDLGDLAHQRLEIGVLGDEVGFGVDLDRHARRP